MGRGLSVFMKTPAGLVLRGADLPIRFRTRFRGATVSEPRP